jgi:hypothetical protein
MKIFITSFRLLVNAKRKFETAWKALTGNKKEVAEWFKLFNQLLLIVKFILYLINR